MELWIRSQDKKQLAKTDEISLFSNTIFNKISGGFPLATYKTDERALEVLDEIQELLKPKNLIYTGDKLHREEAIQLVKMTKSEGLIMLPDNGNITQLGVLVYEMPEK